MTPKHEAIANLTALQTPEPKRRRTAQERARESLVADRDRIRLAWQRAIDKVNAKYQDSYADADRAVLAFEKALSISDEQAPESE